MSSVTFPISLGGDGSTVTDDSNATTGLGNGGHRVRFVPALYQVVACASGGVTQSAAQVALAATQAINAATSATDAAASAASALTAPGTNATSITSLAIGTGSKSLTLAQTGKSFVVGQWVSITNTASPSTQWMLGAITAFTAGTGAMTVSVAASAGTGTLTTWAIAASAPITVSLSNEMPMTVVSATTQTAVKDNHYVLTNVAASTLTLPLTPSAGDIVWVTAGNGLLTNVIARNGSNVMGLAENLTLDNANASAQLRYINATLGWRFI